MTAEVSADVSEWDSPPQLDSLELSDGQSAQIIRPSVLTALSARYSDLLIYYRPYIRI